MSGGGGEDHLVPSIREISSNSDRIHALYSPFRPRTLNPDSYDLKMKFWIKALEEWVDLRPVLLFTILDLQRGLAAGSKSPACLEDVLDTMIREGKVKTEKDYLRALEASAGWMAWGQVNAKKLVGRFLPSSPFSRVTPPLEVRYVAIDALKTLADHLSKDASMKGILMNRADFRCALASKTRLCSEEDLSLLCDYLRSVGLLASSHVGHEEVVLLGSSTISDVDKGKYDVARSIQVHEDRRDELSAKMDKSQASALSAMKAGKRAVAKAELRKKKLAEGRLNNVLQVLDGLESILVQLEAAESNAMVLEAYISGKEALKKSKLTVEGVSEALLDIQEALEEAGEVSAAISQPVGQEDLDLSDLDAELEALMQEEEKKTKKRTVEKDEEEETLKRLKGLKVADESFGQGEEEESSSPASVVSQF